VLRRLEAMLVVMDGPPRTCCRATAISSSPTMGSWRSGRAAPTRWRRRSARRAHRARRRAHAEQAMQIAAVICIYSNDNLTVEVL
jgi:ATP-dependent protease HslVU (ClpYQ) peptidase subunit